MRKLIAFSLRQPLFVLLGTLVFAVAGLIAEGETSVIRPGSAAISYPGFFRELEGVRA